MSKKIRTKGKISFTRYFQEFKDGDKVSIVREPAVKGSFPTRMQGRTGTIKGKRGKAYFVNIKERKMEKNFLIEPIHLKKMKQIVKTEQK
jgi:large subunit ribosomal protein L21e